MSRYVDRPAGIRMFRHTEYGYCPSTGRVYSGKRYQKHGFQVRWRLLALRNVSAGYRAVSLSLAGVVYQITVHRLGWICCNGEIPSGMEINHINGVKTYNRLSNLELMTHDGNMKHAARTGLMLRGEDVVTSVLTAEQVRHIRSSGKTGVELSLIFGVSKATISLVRNRKVWKHI